MSFRYRSVPRRLAAVALLHASFLPSPASADETSCNDAYTEVQRLRRDKKLLVAQTRAVRCGQDECSVTVRTDCARWLDEIERALPSLIVKAQDASGTDLVEVTVRAGSQVIAQRLVGQPLLLDPGEYTLGFEYSAQALERHIVVHEGEKYRMLNVSFPVPAAASELDEQPAPRAMPVASEPVANVEPARPRTTAPAPTRPIPAASYALAAIAGIAGAAFVGLATSGAASEAQLRRSCGTTHSCAAHDVDSVEARYVAADIALGVGVLSLAGAGAVWLFTPAPDQAPLTPQPRLGGLSCVVSGRF